MIAIFAFQNTICFYILSAFSVYFASWTNRHTCFPYVRGRNHKSTAFGTAWVFVYIPYIWIHYDKVYMKYLPLHLVTYIVYLKNQWKPYSFKPITFEESLILMMSCMKMSSLKDVLSRAHSLIFLFCLPFPLRKTIKALLEMLISLKSP